MPPVRAAVHHFGYLSPPPSSMHCMHSYCTKHKWRKESLTSLQTPLSIQFQFNFNSGTIHFSAPPTEGGNSFSSTCVCLCKCVCLGGGVAFEASAEWITEASGESVYSSSLTRNNEKCREWEHRQQLVRTEASSQETTSANALWISKDGIVRVIK